MIENQPYIIPLDAEKYPIERNFVLNDEFFSRFEDGQLLGGNLEIELTFSKRGSHYGANIEGSGYVNVLCDRCLKPMKIDIELHDEFEIEFGDEAENSDEIVYINPQAATWDASWRIYESAQLEVPICHAHELEECDNDMVAILEKLNSAPTEEEGKEIDPRWNALKDIYKN